MAHINRKIEQTLFQWKGNKNSLPLMLIGARQTGSTDRHYPQITQINTDFYVFV
jgi:hypothetical protein